MAHPLAADPPGAKLRRRFETIAATRMAGLPICHPHLTVATEGFEAGHERIAVGILITPWCMNLVRLPLDAEAAATVAAPGACVSRAVGIGLFDFLGASDEELGRYEASSLFSPMAAFADQDEALTTARAILARLRAPAPEAAPARTPGEAMPARRRFLLGLGSGAPR